eukprot:Colp12_sorted_trinity150504_noHs@15171
MAGKRLHPHQSIKHIQTLSTGQNPVAAVLGCADSRAPIELAFDQGFGDLFVCRIAGNLATNEEIGSLEFAVASLGVKVIMVLGHTSCGAVTAALTGKRFPGYIETLVDAMDVAIERSCQISSAQERSAVASNVPLIGHGSLNARTPRSHLDVNLVVRENVIYQVEKVHRSEIIAKAVDEGKVIVVGGIYNLKNGLIEIVPHELPE